jgi:hypothetical protein
VPAGAGSTRSSLLLLYRSKHLAATGSVENQHSDPARLLFVRNSDEIRHDDGYCSPSQSTRGFVLPSARWSGVVGGIEVPVVAAKQEPVQLVRGQPDAPGSVTCARSAACDGWRPPRAPRSGRAGPRSSPLVGLGSARFGQVCGVSWASATSVSSALCESAPGLRQRPGRLVWQRGVEVAQSGQHDAGVDLAEEDRHAAAVGSASDRRIDLAGRPARHRLPLPKRLVEQLLSVWRQVAAALRRCAQHIRIGPARSHPVRRRRRGVKPLLAYTARELLKFGRVPGDARAGSRLGRLIRLIRTTSTGGERGRGYRRGRGQGEYGPCKLHRSGASSGRTLGLSRSSATSTPSVSRSTRGAIAAIASS